jgi:hypothetical protein
MLVLAVSKFVVVVRGLRKTAQEHVPIPQKFRASVLTDADLAGSTVSEVLLCLDSQRKVPYHRQACEAMDSGGPDKHRHTDNSASLRAGECADVK